MRCDRLAGNKLFVYTAKTGVPVWCPVPDFVVAALESCPKFTLFTLAGVPDGHAHRFPDTFAVECCY